MYQQKVLLVFRLPSLDRSCNNFYQNLVGKVEKTYYLPLDFLADMDDYLFPRE